MSFILDALRKSEHDRQRHAGPALAEVPVAPAKSRTNVWATAAIALLLVNLLGVGILLLRRAHEAPAQPPPAAAARAATAVPAPATPAPAVTQPAPLAEPTARVPPQPTGNPLEQEVSTHPGMDDAMAARAAAAPEGPPAVSRVAPVGRGSVVYENAPVSAAGPASAAPALSAAPPAHAPVQPSNMP
ncbi:MAG TPA: hypothetical protein VMT50_06830, partial [Steroidobacteraceae bacterium]|nr:hypothetical protein [Steroidobacteraceae bacterium]